MSFQEEGEKKWLEIQEKIFPSGTPKHHEWIIKEDIIKVLNTVGSLDNSNHMFYPTGGGLDIKSCSDSTENNCLEVYTGLTDIIKPKRLLFESFEDSIWNYFRLESIEMPASGVYEEQNYPNEELIELEPGHYISRSHWDGGEYQGEKLPDFARIVTRHLRGSFVIFAKASHYNHYSNTYDARHDKMTSSEFRTYIEEVMKNGW